jgi:hypothetical protein
MADPVATPPVSLVPPPAYEVLRHIAEMFARIQMHFHAHSMGMSGLNDDIDYLRELADKHAAALIVEVAAVQEPTITDTHRVVGNAASIADDADVVDTHAASPPVKVPASEQEKTDAALAEEREARPVAATARVGPPTPKPAA